MVKPSIYFVGDEGSQAAAFLKTVSSKQTFKVCPEATRFRGEFWDPKKQDEDSLESSRSVLQREVYSCLNLEGIMDIADTAASGNLPEITPVAKDLFLKIKSLALESVRLREPSLSSAVIDYASKKRAIRSQMIRGLAPAAIRDPLMESPIFSEDANIFPSEALIASSALATSIEDKLVLPKERSSKHPFRNTPTKRRRQPEVASGSSVPPVKRHRVETPGSSTGSRDPRLQKNNNQRRFPSSSSTKPSRQGGNRRGSRFKSKAHKPRPAAKPTGRSAQATPQKPQ